MNYLKTTNYIYKTSEDILTSDILLNSANEFWTNIMEPLNSNKVVSITVKVKFLRIKIKDSKKLFNLTRPYHFTSKDLDLFKGLLISSFDHKFNDKQKITSEIIFTYKTLDKENKDVAMIFRINRYRIPMTMDLLKWGEQYYTGDEFTMIRKRKTSYYYKINQNGLTNLIDMLIPINSEMKKEISFTDIRREDDPLNTFTRIFNNQAYYIYNGNKFFKL